MEFRLNYILKLWIILKENDMKLKHIAILAISTVMATSFAHAAPASDMMMADDNSGSQLTSPSAPENVGAMPSTPGSAAQGTGTPNDMSANTAQTPADSSNSNDDMSADTATGDDDY